MGDHFETLITGGTIVTGERMYRADIGIRGKLIAAIGDFSQATADNVVNARGLDILPGVVDTQVHFREPGFTEREDIESGTRSAVVGGVTTIFDMPNTKPPTTTAEALAGKVEASNGRAWANVGFFVGASPENVSELAQLENLPGSCGVKMFMGSSTGTLLVKDDETVINVLRNGKRRVAVHAEDEDRLVERKALLHSPANVREHPYWRDAEAAHLATRRLLSACDLTRRPVHILHVSTLNELETIRKAKQAGLPVTCEVTPQHITLSAEDYDSLGTLLQMNPPIRAEEHRRALLVALEDGLFDVIGSDHAPHLLSDKEKPYPSSPSGMPGVQTLLPVMLDWVNRGHLSLQDLVKLVCERPCSIYGMLGRGHIAEGYAADITVIDLKKKFEITREWIQSKCGWSPFEGRTLTGKPIHVFVNGRQAVCDGELNGRPNGQVAEFA